MRAFLIILIGLLSMTHMDAQYFGRNKPRYRNFQFKVKETPNFDIHYYLKNEDALNWVGQESELWYSQISTTLEHKIPFRNPVLFYNNHAEFQQTNAISGGIGVGTGGVTEGLKNRVIMPLTFSNQQTHQVLGHELVHAFQFNIIIDGDSTSLRNLGNLPLWVVEGMAEYISLGRVDPFTAMWMRNAILNDDVPSLEKMANPRYFPYRYGQAAWSFLGGYYGDQTLKPFFLNTAIYGLETGAALTFDTNLETLSGFWENSLRTYFDPYLRDKKESKLGKTILSRENAGRMNVSPALSPNGRWVTFMSEKDLFSTDIFVADARTGEIKQKLSSLVKDADLDNFNFLESAGTWSPNGKQFAFIGFKKGENVIVIKNVEGDEKEETFAVKNVTALTNPTWSPDGKEIVITGSNEGQTDLYSVNIKSKRVRQLTNDTYSEIQSHFSSDGARLVFSYDKRSMEQGRKNGRWTYDLAIMDYESGSIRILDIFPDADNINPNFDHEDNIYFLSDRDGYRNLYRYIVDTDEVFQMTDFLTGLSGISRYSPVLSASRKQDRVLFTHYYGDEYMIKEGDTRRLLNQPVDKHDVNFAAGTLPVVGMDKPNVVNKFLENIDEEEYVSLDSFSNKRYTPKFNLDYVGGGAGVGVSNSTFGTFTGMQGGIDLLFGDMLGNHQLFSRLALNGEILDFGAQTSYINRTNRVAWGVGLSHVPSRTGYYNSTLINDEFQGQTFPAIKDDLNILRIFDQTLSLFSHLPFSSTLRLEGGVNVGNRGFRWDVISTYSQAIDIGGQFVRGITYDQQREKLELGDQIQFNQFYTLAKGFTGGANIAIVGDNSHFGLTSPLYGQRFRVSLERSFGLNDFTALLGDYRKYFWMKPFSFALRGTSFIRFDEDVQSIYPFYIGQMGFVRGYDFLFNGARSNIGNGELLIEQFYGSKMGLVSAEVRIPFTGPKQLSLIGSQFLLTDLAFFFDAGMAFDEFSEISDGKPYNIGGETVFIKPELAMSVGASVRVNLFGAMILEPYWAYPLQKNSSVVFGLNFIPGW